MASFKCPDCGYGTADGFTVQVVNDMTGQCPVCHAEVTAADPTPGSRELAARFARAQEHPDYRAELTLADLKVAEEAILAARCSHCGGPGPIQVGLCEGCDHESEQAEAGQLAKRRP